MNIIIQSTLKTLQKSKYILSNLSDEQLCNSSISPYYSNVGSHLRHIFDFYDCILDINLSKKIDLTARRRNKEVESCCSTAIDYLNSIIERLHLIDHNLDDVVMVTDDLGLGKVEISYTLAAAFSQANSHTIHHYAIINYILTGLNISLNDTDFGYNPTTPKKEILHTK